MLSFCLLHWDIDSNQAKLQLVFTFCHCRLWQNNHISDSQTFTIANNETEQMTLPSFNISPFSDSLRGFFTCEMTSIIVLTLSLHRISRTRCTCHFTACWWERKENKLETAWCSVVNGLRSPKGNTTCTWCSPGELCCVEYKTCNGE